MPPLWKKVNGWSLVFQEIRGCLPYVVAFVHVLLVLTVLPSASTWSGGVTWKFGCKRLIHFFEWNTVFEDQKKKNKEGLFIDTHKTFHFAYEIADKSPPWLCKYTVIFIRFLAIYDTVANTVDYWVKNCEFSEYNHVFSQPNLHHFHVRVSIGRDYFISWCMLSEVYKLLHLKRWMNLLQILPFTWKSCFSGRTESQMTLQQKARRTVQFERRPSQRFARRQSHVTKERQRSVMEARKEKAKEAATLTVSTAVTATTAAAETLPKAGSITTTVVNGSVTTNAAMTSDAKPTIPVSSTSTTPSITATPPPSPLEAPSSPATTSVLSHLPATSAASSATAASPAAVAVNGSTTPSANATGRYHNFC